ncbi:uncharacterized protein METZ01_LOCUS356024, partial [marine metagenome]
VSERDMYKEARAEAMTFSYVRRLSISSNNQPTMIE